MNIRKLLLTPRTITAFALTVTLTYPFVVEAVNIGEIVLQSRLGEPLLAQVDLIAGSGEHIEDSCLSLATPDPLEKDTSRYLTKAKLSLKTEGKRQYVIISSHKPFNDTFARLRLRVKCPGVGSVLKTLTIWPDLNATALQAPADEAVIRQISPEERAALLAQLKLWENELETIKLQLSKLEANPATVAVPTHPSSATVPSPSPSPLATAIPQKDSSKLTSTVKQPEIQQDNSELQNELFIALGLLLITLAIWKGLRHYTKIKSRVGIKSQQDIKPVVKSASDNVAPPQKRAPSATTQSSSQAASSLATSSHAPFSQTLPTPVPAVAPPKASTVISEVVFQNFPPKKIIEEEVTEEDSMVEEAALYATHGRPAKAVEILEEIIKLRPSKAAAWPLLLSIYSSLGKAAEFEKTAREFLNHHKDSPSWSKIQALGRTFDKNNPLYADSSHTSAATLLSGAANPVRPIGDILMEMGILSKQDLQEYLGEFDPKQHGRFGGYLVARKIITHAQLDQALLQQQGIEIEEKPGDLPSLHDMESFLADFDPKRDGSVSEFLASRNAVTPEQLSQLFMQQSKPEATVMYPQNNDLSSFNKVSTDD